MQGLVFPGDRTVELREFPDPSPGSGQVVVAMRASGMCGSDLRTYQSGQSEFVTGHEPCGVIAERGPGVTDEQAPLDQRVMVHHYWGCGRCKHCRIGYTQMCVKGARVMGFSANGGNAAYLLAPASSLIPLPDGLSFAEGAAIACGTGTAYSALKRLDISGRDTLAVFGQGPVGLAATQLATAMGARVLAVDPLAERRELACRLGAVVAIDSTTDSPSPVDVIRELTHGDGADATLDCTGHPEARANCAKAARAWGRACFVGEHGTATFEMTPDVIHKQLTMYGSWTFSTVLLAECAQFAIDHRVAIRDVFTDTFSLSEADAAFRKFSARGMGKGVFLLDQ
jgi:threonine dehydrogenase-like Zn-dependent dehydrogenase